MFKFVKFVLGRVKAIKYAANGFWMLVSSEPSIIAQMVIAIAVTIFGFVIGLTRMEWLFQITAIGMVFTAESLNTAIEHVADFIHPEFHKKIGIIKDVAAGAAFFAAVFAIIIGLVIYIPKFI